MAWKHVLHSFQSSSFSLELFSVRDPRSRLNMAALGDEDVQEKAAEVGRLFFTNGSVTVNLIPILLFSFLGSLCKCCQYLTLTPHYSLHLCPVTYGIVYAHYFARIDLNQKL